MESAEGAWVNLKHKNDGKHFRRYSQNADETQIHEYDFADDAALLATDRAGDERVLKEYMHVESDFGLTVSLPKTKVMASGQEVTDENIAPIHLESAQPRSRGGPRKQLRDVIKNDLPQNKTADDEWLEMAKTSRQGWRALYREAV